MEVLTLAILIKKPYLYRQESRYNHDGPPAFSTKVLILVKVQITIKELKNLIIFKLSFILNYKQ